MKLYEVLCYFIFTINHFRHSEGKGQKLVSAAIDDNTRHVQSNPWLFKFPPFFSPQNPFSSNNNDTLLKSSPHFNQINPLLPPQPLHPHHHQPQHQHHQEHQDQHYSQMDHQDHPFQHVEHQTENTVTNGLTQAYRDYSTQTNFKDYRSSVQPDMFKKLTFHEVSVNPEIVHRGTVKPTKRGHQGHQDPVNLEINHRSTVKPTKRGHRGHQDHVNLEMNHRGTVKPTKRGHREHQDPVNLEMNHRSTVKPTKRGHQGHQGHVNHEMNNFVTVKPTIHGHGHGNVNIEMNHRGTVKPTERGHQGDGNPSLHDNSVTVGPKFLTGDFAEASPRPHVRNKHRSNKDGKSISWTNVNNNNILIDHHNHNSDNNNNNILIDHRNHNSNNNNNKILIDHHNYNSKTNNENNIDFDQFNNHNYVDNNNNKNGNHKGFALGNSGAREMSGIGSGTVVPPIQNSGTVLPPVQQNHFKDFKTPTPGYNLVSVSNAVYHPIPAFPKYTKKPLFPQQFPYKYQRFQPTLSPSIRAPIDHTTPFSYINIQLKTRSEDHSTSRTMALVTPPSVQTSPRTERSFSFPTTPSLRFTPATNKYDVVTTARPDEPAVITTNRGRYHDVVTTVRPDKPAVLPTSRGRLSPKVGSKKINLFEGFSMFGSKLKSTTPRPRLTLEPENYKTVSNNSPPHHNNNKYYNNNNNNYINHNNNNIPQRPFVDYASPNIVSDHNGNNIYNTNSISTPQHNSNNVFSGLNSYTITPSHNNIQFGTDHKSKIPNQQNNHKALSDHNSNSPTPHPNYHDSHSILPQHINNNIRIHKNSQNILTDHNSHNSQQHYNSNNNPNSHNRLSDPANQESVVVHPYGPDFADLSTIQKHHRRRVKGAKKIPRGGHKHGTLGPFVFKENVIVPKYNDEPGDQFSPSPLIVRLHPNSIHQDHLIKYKNNKQVRFIKGRRKKKTSIHGGIKQKTIHASTARSYDAFFEDEDDFKPSLKMGDVNWIPSYLP